MQGSNAWHNYRFQCSTQISFSLTMCEERKAMFQICNHFIRPIPKMLVKLRRSKPQLMRMHKSQNHSMGLSSPQFTHICVRKYIDTRYCLTITLRWPHRLYSCMSLSSFKLILVLDTSLKGANKYGKIPHIYSYGKRTHK